MAQAAALLYENNFETAALDKVPEEFLVLDGGFVVKEEAGNKFLELPGAPLETFGVLFGPTHPGNPNPSRVPGDKPSPVDETPRANVSVTARVFGTGKGRRSPTFGVGLNGVSGLKLQVSPSKKLVELYKGEEVLASAPYTWESGAWTALRLQLRKVKEGEFIVEGKVWKQNGKEPEAWTINHTFIGDLPAGRASIWGNPYSGTPIRYDDLAVKPL